MTYLPRATAKLYTALRNQYQSTDALLSGFLPCLPKSFLLLVAPSIPSDFDYGLLVILRRETQRYPGTVPDGDRRSLVSLNHLP